jgi:phospholipid N-methyltransferase
MVESLAIRAADGHVPKQALGDAFYFLRRFLRDPRHVASVWPSSRFLAQQMFAGLDLADGDVLVEFGPGTGAFTVEVERLRHRGVNLRYLGIEKDPGMFEFLRRRFPELDFELGDAADVLDVCQRRRLPPVTAVISGLPLIFLDRPVLESIFAGTGQCLKPGGVFRTFSYLHSYPTRRAAELRELMGLCFEAFELSTPVVRNLPPAFVLSGTGPRTVEEPAELALAMAPVAERGFARR